ncbi:MAG: ATP-binding cassette domain-containing protein [Flavobacteriales bacterium]|nr:ATP-binding cassette domain-containing protein [Flavobacteriales bacterium]
MTRFFRLLANDRKDLFYVYTFAIISGVVNLSLPLGIQAIIGLIMAGRVSNSWILLVAIVLIGILATGILQILQVQIIELIQQRIFSRSAFEFAYRIPRIKTESVMYRHAPELVNRFFDTLTVQKGLPKILIDFVTAVLQILFGLILLSFYHPFFVLYGIILLLLLFVIFYFTSPKGLRTSIEESNYKYEVAHWLEELARTMNTFKLAGQSTLPHGKADTLVAKYLKARKSHFRVVLFQFSNVVAFKFLVTGGLLILGGLLVINRELNIGQFVAAEIIIILIINSVEKIINNIETIYDVLTGLEKIGVVTDLPLEKDDGLCADDLPGVGPMTLRSEGLSYRFPNEQRYALKDISVEVAAGSSVAVVGPSGSGKSTLMAAMAGLFDQVEGQISYEEIPLKNWDLESLRFMIGDNLIQEDLFQGSLLDNLTLGRDISFPKVQEAVRAVKLTSWIESLSNGYDTELQPLGKLLSRAVMQKILLARAIIHDPRLLLLEDFGRLKIKEWVDHMPSFLTDKARPWTMIVSTSDPEMVKLCDVIWYMENGRIVDTCTWEEAKTRTWFKDEFPNTPC